MEEMMSDISTLMVMSALGPPEFPVLFMLGVVLELPPSSCLESEFLDSADSDWCSTPILSGEKSLHPSSELCGSSAEASKASSGTSDSGVIG